MTIYAPSELQKPEDNPKKTDEKNSVENISNSRSRFQNNIYNKYHHVKDSTLDFLVDTKDAFVALLQDTKVEIYAGVAAGLIIGGVWSYNHENVKSRCLRLSFSEISQIETQMGKQNKEVPHMTELLAKTNDFYMKVFESYNDSWSEIPGVKDNTASFAKMLDRRVDPTQKVHHYELPQLNKQIPQFADSVLTDLSYIKVLQNKTQNAVAVLDKTWDDYHNDSYHTEIYYTTSTDSKGNTTTTMHTRQVYDYTDNTYKYYKNYGEQASSALNNIQSDCPPIKTTGLFVAPSEVGEENKAAIEKSRKLDLKDKKLTDQEMLQIANTFITGSRQYTDLARLEQLRIRLVSDGNLWRSQKNTARSYSQRTYNYSHAESAEFLTCEDAIETGSDLSKIVNATLGSIESTKRRVPDIMNKIVKYIETPYSKENSSELKKLKKEILSESKDGYYELFNQGVPLEHAKWWHVALFALLGGVIGGAIGAGIDFAGDNTNLYSLRQDSRNNRRREKEEKRYQRDSMRGYYR